MSASVVSDVYWDGCVSGVYQDGCVSDIHQDGPEELEVVLIVVLVV